MIRIRGNVLLLGVHFTGLIAVELAKKHFLGSDGKKVVVRIRLIGAVHLPIVFVSHGFSIESAECGEFSSVLPAEQGGKRRIIGAVWTHKAE